MFPVFCPNWLSSGFLARTNGPVLVFVLCLMLFYNLIILYGFMCFRADKWLHLFLYCGIGEFCSVKIH